MKRFAQLFREMDESNRTSDKVAAVERYFRELRDTGSDEDGAWALFFLTGRRLKRVVNWRMLRSAALRATGLPEWMLGECYEAVGDVSEMLALLVPEGTEAQRHEGTEGGTEKPLHEVVREWMAPMARMGEEEAARHLETIWRAMDAWQRLVFHKLISGTFRVGVQSRLVVRALAQAAGVDAEEMAHRVMGDWEPTAAKFRAVMSPEISAEAPDAHSGQGGRGGRPYPFCLANQLTEPVESLGDVAEWWVEPKWDGIRAQVIRREGAGPGGVAVWSRGEENVTGQFPEVAAAAAAALPPGTVLDGEVVAYSGSGGPGGGGRVLPFAELQKRLNRKGVQAGLFDIDRVVFLAFDALEIGGRDVRTEPLAERKRLVEEAVRRAGAAAEGAILVAPRVEAASWADVAAFRDRAAKDRTSEGVMLKHLRSVYHVGRVRGAGAGEGGGWWKWKVDPFAVDAVLIAAQMGHGKRAGLYTDYTFGVWSDGRGAGERELVPFAKAYSGLTEEEIREVDAFVRRNTAARMGPVRAVRPALVFEIGFEGIRESTRHKSGVAVRFPRMLRWRRDKSVEEADTLERVRELLKVAEGRSDA